MPEEILVGPYHSTVMAFNCFELVQDIFNRALSVFASLEQRHKAEITVIRTTSGRHRRGVAISVLLAKELAVGIDAFQIAKIVQTAIVEALHLTPLEIRNDLRPDGEAFSHRDRVAEVGGFFRICSDMDAAQNYWHSVIAADLCNFVSPSRLMGHRRNTDEIGSF